MFISEYENDSGLTNAIIALKKLVTIGEETGLLGNHHGNITTMHRNQGGRAKSCLCVH